MDRKVIDFEAYGLIMQSSNRNLDPLKHPMCQAQYSYLNKL